MFCPECKTELPDDAKYCIRCGYDFTRIKTPPPGQPSDLLGRLSTSPRPDEPVTPPDSLETLRKGEVFARRYRILSEGNRGGMGVVYKCEDKKLNRTVALKVIHPRLLSSEQAVKRFRQEVSISLELLHKNIVRVHNLDEYEGIEFFTMEWVEGKSLREILNEKMKEKTPFTLEEAYTIISQLSDALQYAHQHTIHRDIKPENILIFESKDGLQVKLTDFGIAKMLTPAQFTSTSLQMGTPYYMAPEQKVDAAQVDKRADIYAVGVVLFELLTLENTIGLEMPSEINKCLPKEIDEVIKRAIATRPEGRYGNIKELTQALGNVVQIWEERVKDERRKAEELRRQEEERRRREAEEEQRRQEEEEKRRRIESFIDEGKALLSKNDFDGAIALSENVLRLDPKNEKGMGLLEKARSEKKTFQELRRREEEEVRLQEAKRLRQEAEEQKKIEEEAKRKKRVKVFSIISTVIIAIIVLGYVGFRSKLVSILSPVSEKPPASPVASLPKTKVVTPKPVSQPAPAPIKKEEAKPAKAPGPEEGKPAPIPVAPAKPAPAPQPYPLVIEEKPHVQDEKRIIFREDFEDPNWRKNWTITGSSVSVLQDNTLNGSRALRLKDETTSSPLFIHGNFNIPDQAKKVIINISIKVNAFESSYSHGPLIWLTDTTYQSDPDGWSHPFVAFETNQFNPGFLNRGNRRCASGSDYTNTKLKLTIGVWYEIRIEANIGTGETYLKAKRSPSKIFEDYGVYMKDQCSTGKFNRIIIGTGLSRTIGAETEIDNILIEYE